MKKTFLGIGVCLTLMAVLPSCGDNKDGKANPSASSAKAQAATPAATLPQGALPNYRFVDSDSIMLKYNLSIDFNEQMIRLQNNLADEEKRQRSAIQSRANALQAKMESAQTQSDVDALKKEYESIQNMQSQAEQKLTQMGMDMENTLARNAQTVMDSLSNFLRDYAGERGYDAVFIKSVAPYYNPALDVTNEVVEGLNARYNKVKN